MDGSANTGNAFVRVLDRVRRAVSIKNNPSARNIAMLERLFMEAVENKKGARKGNVEYSLNYNDAIDQLAAGTLDRNQNTHLKLLDHTPQIYIDKAGAKDLKIITGWDIAYLAMNKDGDIPGNYHGLGPDVLKKIPHALQDPLYIIKQANGRIAAVTDIVIKGKRSVIVSVELDAFQTTVQDNTSEADNYNLIVTMLDAQPNYMQNTLFDGEIVYNKNKEDPAHFILRLKSLKKAVPAYDHARSSTDTVTQPDPVVNTHSTQGGENYSQNALLGKEHFTGDAMTPEARARWMGGEVVDGQSPSHGDAVTAPFTQGGRATDAATAPMGEAQVMERASQLTAEGI